MKTLPASPIVVIGLGRFGLSVVHELLRMGVPVLAVDSDEDKVQRLVDQVPNLMVADCTDRAALEEAGILDYQRAIVGVGTNQEASILITSLLDELGVEQIWTKAISEQHGRILRSVGAHRIIQPEQAMGERWAQLISGGLTDYMEMGSGWVTVTLPAPEALVGKPLHELRLRTLTHVKLVAFRRKTDQEFQHADADSVLYPNDDVVFMGRRDDVFQLIQS